MDIPEDIRFCIDNDFTFTTSILLKRPKNFTVLYQDLRDDEMQNYHEIIIEMFRKQIGIILWNDSDVLYRMVIKRSHSARYEEIQVKPMKFFEDVPPLIELYSRDQYPQHDVTRLKMLKWIIGDRALANYHLDLIPRSYLLDVMTVIFLCHHKLIRVFEADLILLSIKHVETGTVPDNLQHPVVLDSRAFKVAFLFTKCVSYVATTMQTCGLDDLIVSYLIFNYPELFLNIFFLENNEFRWSSLSRALLEIFGKVTGS
jgi:hypothetical protein